MPSSIRSCRAREISFATARHEGLRVDLELAKPCQSVSELSASVCRVSSVSFCRKAECPGSTFTGSTSRTRVAICLSADTPASVMSTSTTVVATRGALIGLDLLDAGKRPVDQIGRLEGHAIAGAMLDLLPQRLEILAQMDFLAELQFAPVTGVDDPVLEDLAVDLVDDLGALRSAKLPAPSARNAGSWDRTCRECRQPH